MTRIAAAAAVAAVDDQCRVFVKLPLPYSRGFGKEYLVDISSQVYPSSQNKEKENLYNFPPFDCRGYVGCCGGLLCLHHLKGKITILNPISREQKVLPPSDVKRPEDTNCCHYYACGLGFDSQSNDYKVLRFVTNHYHETYSEFTWANSCQVEIYSLKNNVWKEIPSDPLGLLVQGSGIYLNNTRKRYWISYRDPISVVSFDFDKESLSSPIPMPNSLLTDFFKDIFEYKGSLAVIGYKKSGFFTLFEAYILKEQEQEQYWEKEFDIEVFGDHRPLGFGKNGQLLFLEGNFQVENNKGGYHQLLVYDLIDRYLKELPIFPVRGGCMQILSCSYSGVEGTVVLPGAKQFVEEGMEIENPRNHHPYTNFGSKSMASRRQVSIGSTEQGQGLNKRRAAVWSFRTTKEETCTGCMAGYVSTLEDGLKKKNPGTDLKGNPHIISISTFKRNYYFESQGLSGSEVGFKAMGDFKIENVLYGKLVTGGGDYHVNCVYQEEQHPIPPKNKDKKRKSYDGVEQVCSLLVEQLD